MIFSVIFNFLQNFRFTFKTIVCLDYEDSEQTREEHHEMNFRLSSLYRHKPSLFCVDWLCFGGNTVPTKVKRINVSTREMEAGIFIHFAIPATKGDDLITAKIWNSITQNSPPVQVLIKRGHSNNTNN